MISVLNMNDTKLPRGNDVGTPSGRFVLRIDPLVHAALRDEAARCGLSLNEYCARRLAAQGAPASGAAAAIVRRAVGLCGEQLIGVAAFGSWARDQLADSSDVDVLVVLADARAITRSLYREWDDEPLEWDARPVQVHFARLPESGARISGLWAEAAVEGILLFDRDFALARRLVELRRRIVAGEIVRREIDGHPYWVEAA